MADGRTSHAEESTVFQIVAGLTHDLKTPLNAMLSLVGVLLREIDGPLNSEQRLQVEGIRRNGEHLLELVNQLLDKSSLVLRSTSPQPGSIDVADLIRELIGIHQPLADERQIKLNADCSQINSPFSTDRSFIRQILGNLIGNSLKFTPAGGQVSVVAGLRGERDKRKLWIDVVDTGAGIRWSQQGHVFEVLAQDGSSATTRGNHTQDLNGIGLGLSLVRAAVRSLGGELEVRSEVSKGTLFSISLPELPDVSTRLNVVIKEEGNLAPIVEQLASELNYVVINDISKCSAVFLSLLEFRALSDSDRESLKSGASAGRIGLFITHHGTAAERQEIRQLPGAQAIVKPFDVEAVRRLFIELRTKALEAVIKQCDT